LRDVHEVTTTQAHSSLPRNDLLDSIMNQQPHADLYQVHLEVQQLESRLAAARELEQHLVRANATQEHVGPRIQLSHSDSAQVHTGQDAAFVEADPVGQAFDQLTPSLAPSGRSQSQKVSRHFFGAIHAIA
jgi:hypothetical protein